MLANGPLIKAVRRTRQLDLTVERFVRYAEQHTIWNAQAEAIRSNCRAFHIDRNCSGFVEPARGRREAQFPVPIIRCHNRSGPQPPFQLFLVLTRHRRSRLLQRDLHFGNWRHGNFRR